METLGIERRRIGAALVAFGLIGVALAGVVAVGLIVGGLSIRSTGAELEADRLALVESLERVSASVGNAADATGNVGETLESTATVIDDTNATLLDLAGAVDSLVDALAFEILGQQPLAGAAAAFAGLSDRLETFAGHLDEVASDLGSNQADLDEISADLVALQDRIDALATRVADFDRLDQLVAMTAWGLLLGAALAAWIAVAGAVAAWIGWRLRRAEAAA